MAIYKNILITQEFLDNNPDSYFIFGDNLIREGMGGAAALRYHPHAIGFITKKYPDNKDNSFYKPEEYSSVFFEELKKLKTIIQKKPNKKFLPRVILLGTDEDTELKSSFVADFESTEIFTLNKNYDKELDSNITNFDPDCIITIGDSYEKFPNLCTKSFDVRRRWIHFPTYEESVGNSAYYCASNYILTPHYKENPLVSFFTPIYNTGENRDEYYKIFKKFQKEYGKN